MTSKTGSFTTKDGVFPVQITKIGIVRDNNRCSISEDGNVTLSFTIDRRIS